MELRETKELHDKVNNYIKLNEMYNEKKGNEGNLSELLKLNEQIILLSSHLYQYWGERKEILVKLMETEDKESILNYEVKLTTRVLPYNSKIYVVWHHRKWAISQLSHPDWDIERGLCAKMIQQSNRNCLLGNFCLKIEKYVIN